MTFTAWVTLMIFVFRWFVCKRSVEKKVIQKWFEIMLFLVGIIHLKKMEEILSVLNLKRFTKTSSSSDKLLLQIYVVDEDGKEHLATMPYGSETFSNIFGSETKNTQRNHHRRIIRSR